MNTRYTIEEVVVASLLHDIGKLLSRTSNIPPYLEPDEAKLYKYSHALITHSFLSSMARLEGVDRIDWNNVQVLASKHHRPDADDPVQNIIRVADHISAGFDRKRDGDKNACLPSLSLLFSDSNERRLSFSDYLPKVASGEVATSDMPFPMFPSDSSGVIDNNVINEHFEHLIKDLSGSKNVTLFIDAVMWFCKRFMCTTPSDMRRAPKISLYDHSVTTAAAAAALMAAKIEGVEVFKGSDAGGLPALDRGGKLFTLVAGGFDGIQNFILSAKGTKRAASALRGRSLFVQLFCERTIRRLLTGLGLYSPNVIMSAAGKFWILAPNIPSTTKTLDKVRSEVEKSLQDDFDLGFSFSLISHQCSADDLGRENFGEFRRIIVSKIAEEELRPFRRSLEDRFVLSVSRDMCGGSLCSSCGRIPVAEEGSFCAKCEELIENGRRLRTARYLVWKARSEKGGLFHSIEPYLETDISLDDCKASNEVCGVENIEFEKSRDDIKRMILPNRIFGRHVPLDDLGKISRCRYLAALKVDVDDLGKLVKEKVDSLSMLATFSRVMDHFFSVFVQFHLDRNPAYRDNVYTVYSGGDDLFVIGDLVTVVDLAFFLRRKFVEFTGGKDVHFSAGISVHHKDYPVRFIAEESERQLKLAKEAGKDSLSFQNDVMKWDDAEVWHKEFIRLMSQYDKYNSQLWRRMLNVDPKKDILFDAHLKYYVARNLKEGDPIREDILKRDREGIKKYLKFKFSPVRLAIWANRADKQGG